MLQLKDIRKDYITSSEVVPALKGVDLSFRQREFVSILGPSGCGKTTLLNIIGGLDHYTSGDLTILGKSTSEYSDRDWDVYRNHRIGFIFQSYNLIPHQTVLGNVELALTIAGMAKEERIAKAKLALDRVGLAGQYYKRPNQLSGGQCQRVAIARALVNDPEILLADEPTGALDTVTSKQIMDLIREISGERLVIMVTHNPEIAEEYSSRIIRLLDGLVIEDTNPYSAEEEEAESAAIVKAEEEALQKEIAALEASGATPAKIKKAKKKKKEKAKMSFITAFKLSARNLFSKKGRTTMVGIAGSIGIIGIALVLAFSSGIMGFITYMQDDMLSGNPIEIAETGFNASAVNDILSPADRAEILSDLASGKVAIKSTIENLAAVSESINRLFSDNTITEEYIEYVRNMPKDYYSAMTISYGINMATNVFTDFKYSKGDEAQHISVQRLIDTYTSVLKLTEYAQYSAIIPYMLPSLNQAPNSADYILSQYDLVGNSKVATEKGEIMLVLNSDDKISDLLLAIFGYYTQEEFLAIVDKATAEDPNNYNSKSNYREHFTLDELLGKEFMWYPADTVFTEDPNKTTTENGGNFTYQYNSSLDKTASGGVPLKVVGILTPKDNISFGALSSGIYYTEALAEHIVEVNKSSTFIHDYLMTEASNEIAARAITNPLTQKLETLVYTFLYNYEFYYDDPTTPTDETAGKTISHKAVGKVGTKTDASSMMGMFMGASTSIDDVKETLIRNLGGNPLANNIQIYPKSFDEKGAVTDYLDAWNKSEGEINGLPLSERTHVTYTDTLELIIALLKTMIEVITYALVAFTSVSLVVSTVMIGIITYVSVVERIKEIGVIRSLGGRKSDVRHLFNAETFIIGLLAGLIGVICTYGISVIVNLIVGPMIGYDSIAALPFWQALMLIGISIGLTCISGLIPASSAAKKDPVVALRTE